MVNKRNVVFLTPFRNAAGVVARYFDQVNRFAEDYKNDFDDVIVIALEGDSRDGTRELIGSECAKHNNLVGSWIVDVSHGKEIVWKSVEDPIRLETMGRIMDRGLEEIRAVRIAESDIIVWIMSDLDFKPQNIKSLIESLDSSNSSKLIVAPLMLTPTNNFYDTWAFRLNGTRFTPTYPFHAELDISERLAKIDSAGSCLVMYRSILLDNLSAGNLEAVSFCQNARQQGVSIWVDLSVSMTHGRDKSRPKLLYVGYFFKPFSYARLAHALVSKLAETFEITILAIGYNGDPHDLPYRVWPSGNDVTKKMTSLINDVKPDVVMLHDETYGITQLAKSIYLNVEDKPLVIAWTEIEGTNQCAKFSDYGVIDVYVAPTEFAVSELSNHTGEQAEIKKVHHGVDTSIFNVRLAAARQEIRSRCEGIDKDTIVFGVVCVNQMRKRIDLALRAFALVCEKSPSEDLKMVVLTRNVPGGYDLGELCIKLNILDKVAIIYDQYSDRDLSELMNVFDVFVSTSIGEGWCLAAHEALACGARLVVPNHSGFLEWCDLESGLIDKSLNLFTIPSDVLQPLSPVNELVYVDGLLVDFEVLVSTMSYLANEIGPVKSRVSDIKLLQSDEMDTISQLIIDRLELRKVAD